MCNAGECTSEQPSESGPETTEVADEAMTQDIEVIEMTDQDPADATENPTPDTTPEMVNADLPIADVALPDPAEHNTSSTGCGLRPDVDRTGTDVAGWLILGFLSLMWAWRRSAPRER